ncbi:PepSY domain-containing protein [Arthrobacter sp. H35-D1]|uniref:PepSY domain-containing protein n=1 Tax=Arthrobacter sp. H35-D1 TaxID=3046202 RepID=UPI0024BB995C|nr:PepSY domain-containing protein [Arthrobacter sp. H35-D1]MDJ0314632.1 PepSY domain-containing protein [Arthrobacter sp. H35-D1]
MSRCTLAILAVATLALTGCTKPDSPTDPPPPVTATQSMTEAAPQASDATQQSSEPAAPGATADGATADGAASLSALVQAGRTALNAVPDSTVTSLDMEGNGEGWEVEVTAADGTEHEMQVSADGASVLSGPTSEHDDAVDKARHVSRMKAASVDYEAAANKVLSIVPNRTVVELELDDENGTVVWEAEVRESPDAKYSVLIDAGSGELIQKKHTN